jgi:hypothetical protein
MSEEKKIGAHRFVYHCDLSGNVLIEAPDANPEDAEQYIPPWTR